MSLVAYGSSDESDSEEQEQESPQESPAQIISEKNTKTPEVKDTSIDKPTSSQAYDDEDEFPLPVPEKLSTDSGSATKLFSSLPAPKAKVQLYAVEEENEEEAVPKQVKKTVKISVPSLSDFKEDEESEPSKKRLKPSVKGSGLFALLPAPRNPFLKEKKSADGTKSNAPLVPRAVSKPPVKPAPPVRRKPLVKSAEESLEDDGTHIEPKDFFSLDSINDVPDVPPEPLPDVVPQPSSSSSPLQSQWVVPAAESQPSHSQALAALAEEDGMYPPSVDSDFIPMENNDLQLSDEALEKLCGRRGMKQQQEMEVIDVHSANLLPDPNEWLTKQLTEERQLPARGFGHRRHDGPTSQQRRKHQITYLAYQAKENELELKNQWSQNRMSRKQTQSKYGF